MAAHAPASKGKTGLGGFPSRLKSFVQDMKVFRKDTYRRTGTKSEASKSKQPSLSESPVSVSVSIPAPAPVAPAPATEENTSVIETRSLSRDTPRVRSLSVRVIVNFDEPLNYSHSQDYEGSSSLQPTEELCEALVRRVDHCSKELITRRDSSALDRTGSDGLAKPLRYEIQLQVRRNEIGTGTEAWASRTLRSYQRQPLGTETAREVILSTHYMVGLFLRHHDEAFVWKDGPVREDPIQEQKTFPYRSGRVQPLTSIPRSFFIEKQQDFESIPGYTVSLSFTSQNHHRTPRRWHETVEINSQQLSPLTLASAENLFLDACYSLDGVFKAQRKEFEALQKSCATHSGCQHCRSQDGDGVEMLVSVKNNVGPVFENLERTTCTRVPVFWKDQATDCAEFVDKAKAALARVCSDIDESVSWMNDFEFYIVELRGRGWTIDEPMAFTLGPEACLCRRTVETLLDRLQTGVADVLRGNAIAVRMTARKRGHFILHKTLVARDPVDKPGEKKKSTTRSKAYVLDRLKRRIEHDIEMVCKDTCTIVSRDADTISDRVAASLSEDYSSMNTGLLSSRRLSEITTLSKRPAADDQGSSSDRQEGSESRRSGSPPLSTTSSSPQHSWNGTTRDPNKGTRAFPLAPGRRASYTPSTTTGARRPVVRRGKFGRYDTTAPLVLNMTHEKANTATTQTTSSSSESITEQESAETSLTESRRSRRDTHTMGGPAASIGPRTPELEYGGSPSIRSSIMITPKPHEAVLHVDVDIVRKPTPPEVVAIECDGNGRVGNYMGKLYMNQPTSSPLPRLVSHDGEIASIISEAKSSSSSEEEEDKHPAINNNKKENPAPETATLPPLATIASDLATARQTDDKTPVNHITTTTTATNHLILTDPHNHHHNLNTPAREAYYSAAALAAQAERDAFSQSKPDFDFSSPLTDTCSEVSGITVEEEPPPPPLPPRSSGRVEQLPEDEEEEDIEVEARPGAKPYNGGGYLGSFHAGLRRALGGGGGGGSAPATPPSIPLERLSPSPGEKEKEREREGSMTPVAR